MTRWLAMAWNATTKFPFSVNEYALMDGIS
jgi:hypothetical protein